MSTIPGRQEAGTISSRLWFLSTGKGKLLIAASFESKRELAVRASCFGEKNSQF